jgi:hypothetical protein
VTSDRSIEYLASLVRELCALRHETEWVEFKMNDAEPRSIGEYISALANSAALEGKASAYIRGRGFDKKYHLDLILALVREHGPVSREEVNEVLMPKLPDRLTEEQKLRKVNNLLQELRNGGRISNRGSRARPAWTMVPDGIDKVKK